MQGTVKFFNTTKGLVSFNLTAMERTFSPYLRCRKVWFEDALGGQKVSFDLVQDSRSRQDLGR